MVFEADMASYLTTPPAAVQALLNTRVYPQRLPPEPTFPAITYLLVTGPPGRTQEGVSYKNPLYRFSCWGQTYDDAVAAAIALIADLEGRAGPATSSIQTEERDMEPEADTGLFRRIVDFRMWV